MKKLFLFAAAALLIGTAAQSQDVKKQQGGEQNLEFLFAPLGSAPIGINGIKYRKFTSATTAWRATVFLGFNTTTDKTLTGKGSGDELKTTNSNFDISIAPGIESHFAGTDALSPYVGAEALVGFSSSVKKEEAESFDDKIIEYKTKDGSISVGVNAFAGMDWYFAHRLYLGAEMGFGIQFTTEMDTKYESNAEGSEDFEEPNGSSLSIGPNVVGKLRIGFLF